MDFRPLRRERFLYPRLNRHPPFPLSRHLEAMPMHIATYTVENLFRRAKVLNPDTTGRGEADPG